MAFCLFLAGCPLVIQLSFHAIHFKQLFPGQKNSPATGLPSISFSLSVLCSHRVICSAGHQLMLYLTCKKHDEINWM